MAIIYPLDSSERYLESGFGATMAAIRQKQKLGRREVAEAAHLDSSYVASLERGSRYPPPNRTVARIARALKLSERESRQLQRLAATERIAHAIECNSDGLGTGTGFRKLVQLAPTLDAETLSAINALLEALTRIAPANQKETSM